MLGYMIFLYDLWCLRMIDSYFCILIFFHKTIILVGLSEFFTELCLHENSRYKNIFTLGENYFD